MSPWVIVQPRGQPWLRITEPIHGIQLDCQWTARFRATCAPCRRGDTNSLGCCPIFRYASGGSSPGSQSPWNSVANTCITNFSSSRNVKLLSECPNISRYMVRSKLYVFWLDNCFLVLDVSWQSFWIQNPCIIPATFNIPARKDHNRFYRKVLAS